MKVIVGDGQHYPVNEMERIKVCCGECGLENINVHKVARSWHVIVESVLDRAQIKTVTAKSTLIPSIIDGVVFDSTILEPDVEKKDSGYVIRVNRDQICELVNVTDPRSTRPSPNFAVHMVFSVLMELKIEDQFTNTRTLSWKQPMQLYKIFATQCSYNTIVIGILSAANLVILAVTITVMVKCTRKR
jgi:hypothetical protein